MKHARYSPLEADAYRVKLQQACAVHAIKSFDQWRAIWNMLWLSVPEVDHLLSGADGWIAHNTAVCARLKHIISDVLEDELLQEKLALPAADFLNWFGGEDHSIFNCYAAIGPGWVDTVMSRAEEAAMRGTEVGQVVSFRNNAVVFNFPQLQRPTA